MKVAILGCGPAGLLAAHACREHGIEPKIFSKKVKSPLSGAQYLHDPIPGLTLEEPDGSLHYVKMGDARGYANKVYGSPYAPCSWEKFPEGHVPAWSMSSLYNQLWNEWSDKVVDYTFDSFSVEAVVNRFDLVISTISRKVTCKDSSHEFKGAQVFIYPFSDIDIPDNTIVYNGERDFGWYRCSRIFGEESTEATTRLWDVPHWEGIKPTTHNCTCYPEMGRVGRFGRWDKGVLIHHAYRDAMNILEGAKNAVH